VEEKQTYIRRELDRILQERSVRTALLGAAIFLILSPLDFFGDPDHALRFLGYRVVVAALLIAIAQLGRRAKRHTTMHLLVYLGTLASAIALEAMILDLGGHRSPYMIGLILVFVVVSGLIPSGLGIAALNAGTIFLVYTAPILLWDTIEDPGIVIVSLVLLSCVLAAGILICWFNLRHLVGEISMRFDLTRSRQSLEAEVAGHAQTNTELRDSRELLSSITNAALDAIVMVDHEGIIRYWNPAAAGIFGYQEEEAVGRGPFTFLVAPEKVDTLLAEFRAWQSTGTSSLVGRRIVNQGLRKNGEAFPMELAITAVSREGRLWACALVTDITERTRNEDRLSLFAAAVEGAAEGIYIVDLEGRVIYCNSAAAEQSGRTPGEIIGGKIQQMHRDPAALESTILPALQRNGRWAGEIPGTARTGQPLLLWLSASLVRNPEGRPIAMVGLTRDLADQKKLEDEYVRTQKIESIGVLAGGLAHDFNNLLTIILGNLDLARLFAGSNPDAAEALDHASEAALRAGDLTRQLITFSKGGQPVKRIGSIARLVRETVVFAAAGSNLACEFTFSESLPPVDFDEGQMRQVIHNLVQNAREAMPDGGTLRVRACAIGLAHGEIPGLPAGSFLRLDFEDHGVGIARENLSRIFDPYFSTKEMSTIKGRGLGLAVSSSIVRNHGGAITANSVIGEGSTITVYLPETTSDVDEDDEDDENDEDETQTAAAPPESLDLPEPVQERLPAGQARGRVLVMDDEPLVLEMAGAVLRRLGYEATLSRSGAEAIVQYQIGLDSGRCFDVVILDLTVPGGNGGPETLARLREIDPGVSAALSSGYTDHPAMNDWAGTGFKAFIAKPYSLKAFEELLAKLV